MVIPLTMLAAGTAMSTGAEIGANKQAKTALNAAIRRARRTERSGKRRLSRQGISDHLDAQSRAAAMAAAGQRGKPLTMDDQAVINQGIAQADLASQAGRDEQAERGAFRRADAVAKLQDALGRIPKAGQVIAKNLGQTVSGLAAPLVGQALGQKMSDIRMGKTLQAAAFDPKNTELEGAALERATQQKSLADKRLELEALRHTHYRGMGGDQ